MQHLAREDQWPMLRHAAAAVRLASVMSDGLHTSSLERKKLSRILKMGMFLLAVSFTAALSGCTSSEGVSESSSTELESSTDAPVSEPETRVWVDPVFEADIAIYDSLDAACGTNVAEKALIAGSGGDASGNASFLGMASAHQEAVECILEFTETPVSWQDLEAGVEEPVISTTGHGAWGVRGAVNNLGDDAMITLNLFFLKQVQEGHFTSQE